jgi:outer membrane murein-binding lipoprotein Lpp
MEWLRDNTNMWILIVILIICFLWALSATFALNKSKSEIQDNLAKSMSIEEKYDSLLKEKMVADEKVKQAQQELEQQKTMYANTLTELNQEKLVTQALKEKLETTTQANKKLQDQLPKTSVTR